MLFGLRLYLTLSPKGFLKKYLTLKFTPKIQWHYGNLSRSYLDILMIICYCFGGWIVERNKGSYAFIKKFERKMFLFLSCVFLLLIS